MLFKVSDGEYKLPLAAAVFVALISLSLGAHTTTCRQSYQDTLNEALRIKEDCDNAVLYDCCQVEKYSHYP